MADISDALYRIADILQTSSEPSFFQTTAGTLLVLALGAFFGAIATYIISKSLRRDLIEQEKRKKVADRQLLSGLLGDEIELRWRQGIGKYLNECFEVSDGGSRSKICNMKI